MQSAAVLRTGPGQDALATSSAERILGLIHLGRSRQRREPPARSPLAEYVTYLA